MSLLINGSPDGVAKPTPSSTSPTCALPTQFESRAITGSRQAIQSAYGGDFAPFHRLVDALAAPYVDQVEYVDLEAPPQPDEVVHETFCGT